MSQAEGTLSKSCTTGAENQMSIAERCASDAACHMPDAEHRALDTEGRPAITDGQPPAASRQAVYAFFADLFLAPIPCPGSQFAESLAERVQVLAESASLEPVIAESFRSFLAECGEDAEACQQRLAIDRAMLFRCTRPSKVALPPREGLHRTDQPETTTLVQLASFYDRCHSGPAEGVHEAPDYLGIELAFMAELLRCSLDARDDDGETGQWAAVQQAFLAEHLGIWAPECCAQLADAAETPAFRGLLGLLAGFLAQERTLAA